LQAKNANFNINHLGALPIQYVVDMYGSNTGSSLHGALPTDRFVVRWELSERKDTKRPPMPIAGDSIPIANPVGNDGLPFAELLRATSAHAGPVRVQVPADFSAVQRQGASTAMRWRVVLREVMRSWLDAGYRVSAFVRPDKDLPWYQLEPGT
jgi:predicted GNAT superfamily acetyltransferase